jgi:hypothetical protein
MSIFAGTSRGHGSGVGNAACDRRPQASVAPDVWRSGRHCYLGCIRFSWLGFNDNVVPGPAGGGLGAQPLHGCTSCPARKSLSLTRRSSLSPNTFWVGAAHQRILPAGECRCLRAGGGTMRIPGVSVFCVAASLLVAQSPYPDLSGKRRIDRSKVQESVT